MAAPNKLNAERLVKLKQAAAIDASVEEMAYYCDVSRQTIHNWLKADPELFDEIERLRAKPILKARQTIVNHLGDSYQNAADYLKRKKRLEFGDNIDHTTGGEKLTMSFDQTFDAPSRETTGNSKE